MLDVRRATSLPARLRGLLGTAHWPRGRALLIRPCSSVHTAFMRYAIDVVFIDRRGQVLRIAAALRPWRMASAWGAVAVLELAAGEAQRLGWSVGDVLPRSVWA
ncbi:MAG: DUF192 domain-containing protein [Pseudomonadota bacterium]